MSVAIHIVDLPCFFLMGKSTMSMAIFNSELLIFYYLRGYILHPTTPMTPMAAVPLPTRRIDLVLEWNLYILGG